MLSTMWLAARTDAARVALAVLRYEASQGRLPDTLDALVPKFLKAVPAGPLDGKPLCYAKEEDGFFVYVGPFDREEEKRLSLPMYPVAINMVNEDGTTTSDSGLRGFRVRRPKDTR